MLLSTALSPAEAEYIAAVSAARRISIHARRGDYLTPEASVYHGVAEPGYFSRALRLYDRLHPGSQYRIYTDSRELVAGEFAGVEQAELAPVETGLRSVAAMLAMATADGIIISNSTFSWWAGWLISERETNATVIAPRPWFRSGESASDLLLPDWITLDARN
jgi:hypothetical protein